MTVPALAYCNKKTRCVKFKRWRKAILVKHAYTYYNRDKEKAGNNRYYRRCKRVHLDIYVKDGKGTVYNIEMQTTENRNPPRRARCFYQGMIDLNILQRGDNYKDLGRSFIFLYVSLIYLMKGDISIPL